MDRRSWPWRKKSSEKTVPTDSKPSPVEGSNGTAGNQDTQDSSKNVVSSVQLSQERYTHLSKMEDQVKLLNEQLSTAQSELATKETMIKQHTKVAEEAVSGWEKAEAEALELKNQLESVTLQRLTAEDRAAHLDGALKECMKQIRNVKEEGEQKLHDVVFAKTKQWEKIQYEFEAKINVFEQELMKSAAEISALSRSLEERSDMVMKISEEKAQADAEIEILRTNIQSCERELSSMQYEVHIVSKELEIRNEEKNMSVRSAEVANKHHLEDVKKITKLEAECQRLRGLVRKKLPGPAALAQMKVEVDSLGRDYSDNRVRRSPIKNSSLHLVSSPDYALENIQQCQKENEFLSERLLSTEEETKMLKEALSKRNSELQVSRNMFAKTASKLRTLEAQMLNQQRSPSKFSFGAHLEDPLVRNVSSPPSVASVSEDGIEDAASCSGSWATALISELSHLKKDKDVDKSSKAGSASNLELMDDFLEMERIACLSTESNGPSILDGVDNKNKSENANSSAVLDLPKDVDSQKVEEPDMQLANCRQNEVPFSKLQSKITSIFQGQAKDGNMVKLLEDIKHVVHETEGELHPLPVTCIVEDIKPVDAHDHETHSNLHEDDKPSLAGDLKNTISKIHDLVLLLFASFSDSDGPNQKVEEFSSTVNKVLSDAVNVDEFITSLCMILSESYRHGSKLLGNKDNDRDASSPDCIDKVALLENKVVQHEAGNNRLSDSSSDAEIKGPDNETKHGFTSCSLEEFEQLKLEKEKLAADLSKSDETLQQVRSQLQETEQRLEDLDSQLVTSKKSNGLAETQLKCMAESYRSLELRATELENEINMLQSKLQSVDTELQEERCAHQECLAKCKDLQEQIERNANCSVDLLPSETNAEVTTKQEMEIAAASEKLAECQETIFLLGKQLKSMQPLPDLSGASPKERVHIGDDFSEDIHSTSGSNQQGWPVVQLSENSDMENTPTYRRTGSESPFEGYNLYSASEKGNSLVPRSPINPKNSNHRPSRSSSSPNQTEGKQGRGGFSRFFSKGKSNQ